MKKILLALVLLYGSALPSHAQTSPGLYQGQVPTSAQWNSYFANKQDVLGYTPLNSNGGSMLGELITAAPSSLSSGFNLPPGVAPGVPNNGDLWTTAAGLYAQINGATVGPFTSSATPCTNCALTTNPLSQFATTTSAQLRGVLSDETGTGFAAFSISPVFTTPSLGAATATSINGNIWTAGTGTLTIAAAKTITANNSLTLAGTDGTTLTFQGTDTYVGRATTDTLTNKTINGSNNTITNLSLSTGVTGNLPPSNLNSGTSASSSTFWRGDGTWATPSGGGNVSTTGSPSANQLTAFASSTTVQGIGPGLVGQSLRSNGSGSAPSYQSGGWTLIGTITASNSATINDSTACSGGPCLTSTYNEYEIVFEDIVAATGATGCQLQVHSGGSYQATSYVATASFAGSASGQNQVTTNIPCGVVGSQSTTMPSHSVLRINNPSTSSIHAWTGYSTTPSGTVSWVGTLGGVWNSAAVIDGFQVLMSSGNIASGKVKIYGRL